MKFCRSSTCVTEYPNRIFNFETWKRFNLTKRKKTENLTNIIDDYRLFSENGIIFSSLPRFRRPFSLVWCAVRRRSMTEIDGILKGRKSKLNKIKSGGNWFVCVFDFVLCSQFQKPISLLHRPTVTLVFAGSPKIESNQSVRPDRHDWMKGNSSGDGATKTTWYIIRYIYCGASLSCSL